MIYQNGELTAKSFDKEGRLLAEKTLKTGGTAVEIRAEAEQKSIKASDGLAYIRLKYTDEKGEVLPLIRGEITVSVENGELIGFGSACPYYEKSYKSNIADTYYGEALAVIKPEKTGKIVVKAHSGYGDAEVEVEVE